MHATPSILKLCQNLQTNLLGDSDHHPYNIQNAMHVYAKLAHTIT